MKLKELSIADLKSIYDYAIILKDNWSNVGGIDVDEKEAEDMMEYWDEVRHSAYILLEARIKQIFP